MTRLLILDMDGTVRHPISNPDRFILHPKDQVLFPEAIAAIKEFRRKGFAIVGASNQAGVAAGKKTLQDCIAEQAYTLELLYEADAEIDSILFCPDYEGWECYQVTAEGCENIAIATLAGTYRKPQAGMLNHAISMYGATEVVFVGDRNEDKSAADAVKAQGFDISFIWAHEWRSGYWIA